jgi:hypothetical protein
MGHYERVLEMRNAYKILQENLKERNDLGGLNINGGARGSVVG